MSRRSLLSTGFMVTVAEALSLPVGFALTVYLSRSLGPSDFGLLTLTATIVAWIEWTIASFFAHSTVKFVSEAGDWNPVATALLRMHVKAGVIAAVALLLLAHAISGVMGEPRLQMPLMLMALDIPIFCAAHAHRSVLTGIGRYRARAGAVVTRNVCRLAATLLLVSIGFSVAGAVTATVIASASELILSRWFVRLRWNDPAAEGTALRFRRFSTPLLIAAISFRGFAVLDILLLKLLGIPTAEVGVYGVAQSISAVPTMLTAAFSPILIAVLTRQIRNGHEENAKAMVRHSERLCLLLFPFVALLAGGADPLVALAFGPRYHDSAAFVSILVFGGVARVLVSLAISAFVSSDEPRRVLAISVPLIPAAVLLDLFVIPRFGATGAAYVTAALSCMLSAAGLVWIHAAWKIKFEGWYWIAVAAGSVAVYAAAATAAASPRPLLYLGILILLTSGIVSAIVLSSASGLERLVSAVSDASSES